MLSITAENVADTTPVTTDCSLVVPSSIITTMPVAMPVMLAGSIVCGDDPPVTGDARVVALLYVPTSRHT